MKVEKIKELLQERLKQVPLLKERGRDSQPFMQWHLEILKILEHFDKKFSTNFADSFSAYGGYKTSYSSDELFDDDLRKASQHEKFLRDLDQAANLLQTVISIDEELYKKPYKTGWNCQLCKRVYRRVDSLCSRIVWLENNPIIKLILILGAFASIIALIIVVTRVFQLYDFQLSEKSGDQVIMN